METPQALAQQNKSIRNVFDYNMDAPTKIQLERLPFEERIKGYDEVKRNIFETDFEQMSAQHS